MGRHAFRASNKKLAAERREREAQERLEAKERAKIHAPLLGRRTRPPPQVPVTTQTEQPPPTRPASNPNGMMGIAAAVAPKKYTGTALVGIACMHKSNLVPIFNSEAAVEVATMRRG